VDQLVASKSSVRISNSLSQEMRVVWGGLHMLQPLAMLVVTAVVASTPSKEPHRILIVQLIHRCTPPADCLPSRIVALMKKEAERVWSRLDVRLAWIDSLGRVTAPHRAGLIVMLEEGAYPGSGEADSVLADLTQPSDTCGWGLARVWVRHVERHAATVPGGKQSFISPSMALGKTFLGRALGRALAHEIGHYLLGTREHAAHGLMRAQFAPQDLLEDAGGRLYGLDFRGHVALMSCRTSQETEPDVAR
jgi:hypothetical protein